MNSKQRNFLRAMATKIQSYVTIGKGGLSDSVINEISEVLDGKELMKITVLKNSLEDPKVLIDEIIAKLKAEPIATIGNKLVIYRRSKKKEIEHIILPV